jgi:uncharacterized membrane protein YgdD (TMEM256/DUF423 family)
VNPGIVGALLAALGIALGAFGAHGLRATLGELQLGWWNTGVQYQMWSAIGLLAIAALPRTGDLPAILIAAGTIIFSGTLYAMAMGAPRFLGAVTPIGGLLMIAGWSLVAWRLTRP